MIRIRAALYTSVIAFWPASALAQATPHWTGAYAAPLFLAGIGFLLLLRTAFALPGWNRVGIALWHLVMIAGGCLAVYGMQHAAKGTWWQLPAFAVAMFAFAVVGELSLRRLRRP